MITTPSELIDALGGTVAVARALHVAKNTVTTWRRPDRGLPVQMRAELRELADNAGLQYDPAMLDTRRQSAA